MSAKNRVIVLRFMLNKGKLFLKGVAVVLLILLTAAPVIYLFIGTILAVVKGRLAIDNAISTTLFLNSVLINLGAAGLSMLFGLLIAISMWLFFERYAVKIAVLMILLILIPPFIHVQSWIHFIDKLNIIIGQLFGLAPDFTGVFAVILTTAFSYLPITAGLSLFALLGISSEHSDQCILEGGGKTAFVMLYLPFLYPALCIGTLLVFLLNINDYGIPSAFGVNVFALELFSRFSASGSIYSVFFASFPLLLLCGVIITLFGLYIARSNFSFNGLQGKNPFKREKFLKVPAVLGLFVFGFFVIIPIFNLSYEAARVKGASEILSNTVSELSYSFMTSASAAVFCLIPALLFAYLFYKSKAKIWLLSLSALPFIIPSPIAGLSLIEMWNTHLLRYIYQSPIMPAIAMTARYTFIEAIVLSVAISRLDNSLLENMHLHYPGPIRFFKCFIILIWKECVSSVFIVFALAMGEFGVSLLITPPGYQTLTIKIYNYLHYGASETVAALCLFMLFIVLLVYAAVYFLLTGKKNE